MNDRANAACIAQLYSAFSAGDAESMAACYHPDAVFFDPVFGELRGIEIGDMWRMLIFRSRGNLVIGLTSAGADSEKGHAYWTADYTFTGRHVHNVIHAEFAFEDGQIMAHRDTFAFWKWARQALGPAGLLFGWTPFLRAKVRRNATKALESFRNAKN